MAKLDKTDTPSSAKPSPALLVVKIIAIAWGFVATMISFMAVVGALTPNGYARVLVALVVTLIVPLAIADGLLPKKDPTRGKGLVTDVLALWLVGFSLAFTGAARMTGPLLVREGDRLSTEGYAPVAAVAYLLGGVRPEEAPAATPAPESTAAADAGAPVDAGSADAATADAAAEDAAAPAPAVEAAPEAGTPPANDAGTTEGTH
ncbi:hypothetical protein [Polyangium aurulentum]|uniref:hypothetical protein n=1 Tax=Polyangium aurulentum TaxID=2567896 RepID=UPI00197EB46C|nr:hypothetical protein [Polyangium aurulentum]UQA60145.1 hypothetical protein E8A73_006585 [Polyangium aurulentum]